MQAHDPEDDLYGLLGVSPDVSFDGIKQAYFEQVKKYPPETHPEEFKKRRRAYEILFNPKTRSQYDSRQKYGATINQLVHQGELLLADEKYEEAVRSFKRVLVLSPHYENARYYLGLCFVALEQYSEAVLCFTRLASDNPNNGMYHYRLGDAYYRGKQYKEAERSLLIASQLSVFDSNILTTLADVFVAQDRYDDAVLSLDRAINIDGKADLSDLPYLFKILETWIIAGNRDKIEYTIDRIDGLIPDDQDSRTYLANRYANFAVSLFEAKLYALGVRLIKKAMFYDPTNSDYKDTYNRLKIMDPAIYVINVSLDHHVREDDGFLDLFMELSNKGKEEAKLFLAQNSSFHISKLTLERANIYFNRFAKYDVDIKITNEQAGRSIRVQQRPRKTNFKKQVIEVECTNCRTKNRVDDGKQTHSFCGKCGIALFINQGQSKDRQKETEIVDLHVFHEKDRLNDTDFCGEVSKLTGWDLLRVKEFLQKHGYFSFKGVTRKRAKEIWGLFEKYSVEMEILKSGETPHVPVRETPDSSSIKSGWIWWIVIVGVASISRLSGLINEQPSRNSIESQQSAAPNHTEDNTRYNAYIGKVNDFLEIYRGMPDTSEMDLSGKTLALRTYMNRLKDRTEILQNASMPSEFAKGHEILLNGARMAISAFGQIVESLENGYGFQRELRNTVFDKLERADLLVDQGQKELENALNSLKTKK